MKKDLYSTLNVKKDATEDEVKDAYKNLAKEFHPDKQGGSDEKMKELNHAYGILKNPVKRDRYDRTGDKEGVSFEMKFASLVQDIFVKIAERENNIARVNLVKEFEDMCSAIVVEHRKNLGEMRKKVNKFEKVVKRLRSSKENRIAVVLNNNLVNMKQEVGVIEDAIKFMEDSIEVIKHHDYEIDPEPKKRVDIYGTGGEFKGWNDQWFVGHDPIDK